MKASISHLGQVWDALQLTRRTVQHFSQGPGLGFRVYRVQDISITSTMVTTMIAIQYYYAFLARSLGFSVSLEQGVLGMVLGVRV